jgi:hypothetical protein
MHRLTSWTLASLGLWLVGACSSDSSNGGTTAGNDAAAGNPDASGAAVSDSGNGTAPTPMEGGITCGLQGACAPSEECCRGASTNFLTPPSMTCVAKGSCQGASLDCSSSAHCGASEVCCFAYATPDGGAEAGAGGAFGAGLNASYSATCQSSCPVGDGAHYQLCASSADCPSGQQCVTTAPVAPYCAAPYDGGGFPFGGDGGFPFLRDGGGQGAADAAAAAADAADVTDAGAD